MRSHSFKWAISLSILLGLCKGGSAQTNVLGKLDSLAGNFIRSIQEHPREKLLLQTDKSFYLSGETIWFRAFCLNAMTGRISSQSKILFLDLVDEKDQVIKQILLNIPSHQLEGNISLPPDAQEGYYWLRAYTKKMLKEDSSNICVIPVYVLNPRKPDTSTWAKRAKKRKPAAGSGQPVLSFFPEGGELISGTNSLVACKAVDQNGQPLEISGYVKDSWDSVVAHFKTNAAGLCKFPLDIWKARKYTAHVSGPGNLDYSYPLPVVNQYATQIALIGQNPNSFQIRVSLGDSLYHRNRTHFIIGISRGNLCFAASGTDMFDLWIPKQNFPKGMATLLAFDDQGQVVSERNIYISRGDEIVQINTDKPKYNAREKARLDITITDSLHKPVRAYFTVAVTDDEMDKPAGLEERVDDPSSGDLVSSAMAKKMTEDDWDLLMLTREPRYMGWKPLTESKDLKNENDLADKTLQHIHGIVTDNKNRPKANEVVTLFSTQKNIVFLADTTDKQGNFHFDLSQEYQDSTQFTIQVANFNGTKQDTRIQVDSFPFPQITTPPDLKIRFDSSKMGNIREYKIRDLDTLKFGKGKEWLKVVTVKATRKKPVTYDEKKRISSFSHVITGEDLSLGGLNSAGDALLMAPGIQLRNGRISVRGGSGFGIGAEPLLVVDGAPIAPSPADSFQVSFILDYLSQLRPQDIDFIEVLTGPEAAYYGSRAANGVIAVNTTPKTRFDDGYGTRGLHKYFTRGYLEPQAFTSPNYDNKETRKSPFPDLRSTLFWNGNMRTDENGKATDIFFTADAPTTYTVSLMGVTDTGTVLYKQIKIDRK